MKKEKIIQVLTISLLFFLVILAYLIVSDFQKNESKSGYFFTNEDQNYEIFLSGAVKKPGIFIVKTNTIVSELIEIAGGFDKNADIEYVHKNINLAAIVTDNSQIFIPFKGINKITSKTTSSPLVNINFSPQSELETLPGIGPTTAEKIIGSRPIKNIEELSKINGLGEKKVDAIKDYIEF